MVKRLVDIDGDILDRAQKILGAGTMKDTVNRALEEVINTGRVDRSASGGSLVRAVRCCVRRGEVLEGDVRFREVVASGEARLEQEPWHVGFGHALPGA